MITIKSSWSACLPLIITHSCQMYLDTYKEDEIGHHFPFGVGVLGIAYLLYSCICLYKCSKMTMSSWAWFFYLLDFWANQKTKKTGQFFLNPGYGCCSFIAGMGTQDTAKLDLSCTSDSSQAQPFFKDLDLIPNSDPTHPFFLLGKKLFKNRDLSLGLWTQDIVPKTWTWDSISLFYSTSVSSRSCMTELLPKEQETASNVN